MTDFDSPEYRYRPHALAVQAVQVTMDNAREVAEWCNGHVFEFHPATEEVSLTVFADDPYAQAHHGDWVVKYAGKWTVLDTEEFRLQYRPLREQAATTWGTETGPIPAPRLGTGL